MKPGFKSLFATAFSAVGLAALAPHAQALTLQELNQALLQHPEAQWSARDNAAATTFKGKHDGFGLAAGYMESLELSLTADTPTPPDAPSVVDWRNKDGANWVSPVKNQGRCGSCVAFAAIGAFEANYNIASESPGLNFDGSEQDLFGRIGSCDFGSWPSSATSSLKSQGAPDEACFPYVSGRLGEDQDSGACADVAARAVKISATAAVSGTGVKAALQRGPVITTLQVYEDFMYYGGGIYKHVTGDVQGGHAVTIVGYNDDERYWVVKNSWGPEWGEHGYVRVSYDDISGIGEDNYSLAFANPDSYVKLTSPASESAVAGQVTLHAAGTRDGAFRTVPYALTGRAPSHAVRNGQIDPRTLEARFDSTAMDDGVYELKINAETEGGIQSRPWFSLVTVVNHPQNIAVALSADAFDPTLPVKDRVYFMLDVTQQNVPLTQMEIVIAKADGTPVKSITLPNPGLKSKFGWRTAMYPNGDYVLKAVGRIGTLQAFQSNALPITVKN